MATDWLSGPYKMPKTKRGAQRQARALIRAYTLAYSCEGDMFGGWDWPTLRANCPEAYRHLRALKDALPTLPA